MFRPTNQSQIHFEDETSLDLFIDPMMVNLGVTSMFTDSEGMWVWLSDPNEMFAIFSIPFFNFLGWFFIIFGFSSRKVDNPSLTIESVIPFTSELPNLVLVWPFSFLLLLPPLLLRWLELLLLQLLPRLILL